MPEHKNKAVSHTFQKEIIIFVANLYYSSFDLIEYAKKVEHLSSGTNKEHILRIQDGGVIPGEL